jgi:pyruvate/2-oxoacid:ferredoxin oxidoreductase beta subunit
VRDVAEDVRSVRLQADGRDSLQPWQFFVLAALGCATAVTFVARGQGVTAVILLSVLMGAAGLVGIAALRALRPLVSADDDRTAMVGQRTRVALEREKSLTLRAIKELEFDKAMGKLSESDWQEMSARLRVRAAGLMRQLDAGSGYREQIERDVTKRLGVAPASSTRSTTRGNFCTECGTGNESDAKFCKNCGRKL